MNHFFARHRVTTHKHILECACGRTFSSYGRSGTPQHTYDDAKRDLSVHIYNHRKK